MSSEISLTIKNDFAELARVDEAANRFLHGQALSPQAEYAVHIALEEIITNTIKYAYDDQTPHDIHVRLTMTPDCVLIRFEDDGRPFNPLNAKPPDMTKPLEERPIGGMGIHMVRTMADELSYQRTEGRNVLDVRISRHKV